MTDDPWFAPNFRPAPQKARPAERLFEFVRESDRAPMSCELRFHGESYGWEAMFLKRGDLFYSRRFILKAEAIAWANCERPSIEKGWDD